VQIIGKPARLVVNILARTPEERLYLFRFLFAKVALKQHLHRQLT
jgi:hypothetical protein